MYADLVPEACLLAGAVVCLLAGSFLARERQWVTRVVAAAALIASLVTALVAAGATRTVFDGSYALDAGTTSARVLAAATTLLVIALGTAELAGDRRESETYALLLLAALGVVVLAGASDLLVLIVGFLLASIPVYGLIGLDRRRVSTEAAVRTYLLGALAGIVLMLGATVLTALAGGSTYRELADRLPAAPAAAVAVGILAVVLGLLFEAGAVPLHPWVPDAVQGARTTVAAFLTTVPKVGALLALTRLVEVVPPGVPVRPVVAVLAAASLLLGTFAAFGQHDLRRLLGWSTVSQVGFLLLPVAAAGRSPLALGSLVVYLAGYAVTTLALFAVLAALPHHRTLTDVRGSARTHPWLTAVVILGLLSTVGTPPTAVFLGKLTTFTAAWEAGLPWLVVLAALATVASLFYLLRWGAAILPWSMTSTKQASASVPPGAIRGAAATAAVCALGVIVLGVAGGAVLLETTTLVR
ncbi:proton-conducting transporter membrane subunit [Klenkia sp. PcliD-1-E]|uniref:NADH-quinone oxidoreductase subunit N n=1 Tax=Klenkia sp. PcliD-1-E TaxID=2954492 RepID=UPI0020981D4B|nr:proton-conducting transporter membrane subunit [Klenkia sp. PcliD-1-E]MCO7218322.1 NADH-quinone oxidoreductase subunit N [Klenkia sp. PcliD-1-E]